MDWIQTAQQALREQGLSGWLLYDFRGSNPVAGRFLSLGNILLTRRVFLYVPAKGKPSLLVHAIERGSLPDLPFDIRRYSSRETLEQSLKELLPQAKVALEYSPRNDIPYISYVDAGTAELLRSLGVQVVSSAALLQAFEVWSEHQLELHEQAAAHVLAAKDIAFEYIGFHSLTEGAVRETDVQKVMTAYFDQHGLVYDHPPIVAFGAHTGDPHYSPRPGSDAVLAPGDAVLIDIFAKLPRDDAPYADITWMAVFGEPPPGLLEVFDIVKEARDLAVNLMNEAAVKGRNLKGYEVDRAVRDFIAAKGYAEAFFHRTGHSLGTDKVHGNSVHLDDFETHDTRELMPGSGVTVEPGIYLETFGVRSEIDVFIGSGGVRVTTEAQQELIRLSDKLKA